MRIRSESGDCLYWFCKQRFPAELTPDCCGGMDRGALPTLTRPSCPHATLTSHDPRNRGQSREQQSETAHLYWGRILEKAQKSIRISDCSRCLPTSVCQSGEAGASTKGNSANSVSAGYGCGIVPASHWLSLRLLPSLCHDSDPGVESN